MGSITSVSHSRSRESGFWVRLVGNTAYSRCLPVLENAIRNSQWRSSILSPVVARSVVFRHPWGGHLRAKPYWVYPVSQPVDKVLTMPTLVMSYMRMGMHVLPSEDTRERELSLFPWLEVISFAFSGHRYEGRSCYFVPGSSSGFISGPIVSDFQASGVVRVGGEY